MAILTGCELCCGFRKLLGLSNKISLNEFTKSHVRRRESSRLLAIASSPMRTVLHAARMWCVFSQLPSQAATKGGSRAASRKHRLRSSQLSEIPQVDLGHESRFRFGKSCRTTADGGSGSPHRGGRPWGWAGAVLETGWAESLSVPSGGWQWELSSYRQYLVTGQLCPKLDSSR